MTGVTGLDVRLPIGGLFVVLGLLLAGYGLATAGDPARYASSLSVNVNLWWGLVMLVFGLLLLLGVARGRRIASARPASETPEGRAMEARERRGGLEG
jgi:hypothetical protein